MSPPPIRLNRRTLLKAGTAAGGGLLLGFDLLGDRKAGAAGPGFAPNAFIRIDRQGLVTLIMPQVEMGQGVYTSIAMILAEELDVGLDEVTLEAAPPDNALYANPFLGSQVTGNSSSIRAFWTPMRKAGATARAMLVRAAAAGWGVAPQSCRTEHGQVIDPAGARRVGYGVLADFAAGMRPPTDVSLKDPKDFKLIGQPAKRLDTPGKVDGSARFGIDIAVPGAKVATLAACPVFGGKVGRVDDSQTMKVPGVRQVVVLDDLVAVVGDHYWAASQGLKALAVEWDEGPNAKVTQDQIVAELEAASAKPGAVAKTIGDAPGLLAGGEVHRAEYQVPFLAHAPLEPMNYTVQVTPGRCEIWGGTQVITRAQSFAAQALGLKPEQVIIHNQLLGGAFGRRLEVDGVVKAVRIAQHVEGPVRIIWSREEDIQQELYRPSYHDVFAARLDKDGRPLAWSHRIAGSSVLARYAPPAFVNGIDSDAVEGAVEPPYRLPNLRVEYVRQEPPGVPTAFWRGVGPGHNVFVVESFIDELAHKAGKDPVAYRLDLLDPTPRLKAALKLAAEKAGWGSSLPHRTGRGAAVQTSFGSFLATIVEAEVDRSGEVMVKKVVCAMDCGIVVNPDTVAAQIEGGLIFGLTAALHGQITIEGGRVQQSNFNDYRMMRMNEAPKIEVHIIKSGEAPGGMGETATVAASPALANAVFAATGKRVRTLPIDPRALRGLF